MIIGLLKSGARSLRIHRAAQIVGRSGRWRAGRTTGRQVVCRRMAPVGHTYHAPVHALLGVDVERTAPHGNAVDGHSSTHARSLTIHAGLRDDVGRDVLLAVQFKDSLVLLFTWPVALKVTPRLPTPALQEAAKTTPIQHTETEGRARNFSTRATSTLLPAAVMSFHNHERTVIRYRLTACTTPGRSRWLPRTSRSRSRRGVGRFGGCPHDGDGQQASPPTI